MMKWQIVLFSIIKTISNLLNTQRQFSLEPIRFYYLFTINPHSPQQVLYKGSTMIFEHSYDLNDQDLQYFITNTKLDREINNKNIIYSFLNDMKYNIKYGEKPIRYYFIKDLHNQYYQLGSGLPSYTRSNSQSYTI